MLAVDAHDRPALLRRRAGAGALILCTYPLEYMAAVTQDANPGGASTLYDALATYAGARRPVTVDDPRVAADVLVRADGARFAWLVSHAAEPVTVKPQLGSGERLCDLDGTPASETLTLAPYGVGVFAIDPGPAGRLNAQLAEAMAWACALSSRAAALVLLLGSLSQMMR